MYLTDEIFKTTDAAADHPYHSPMDSNPHSPEHLGKRKRGAAADEYTTNTVPLKNIKILPTHLDPFDRPPPAYTTTTPTADPTAFYPSPPRHHHHHRKALPRTFAQPRRSNTAYHAPAVVRPQRSSPETHHHHHHRHVAASRLPAPARQPTTEDLAPCHCCHRAPRQKRDLDNYSACAACGARTCYICMRVCERRVGCRGGGGYNNNNNNGGRKICRECCVESGAEGETWCFDCVAVGGSNTGGQRGEQEEVEGMVMG